MAIESASDRAFLLSDFGEDATIGAETVTVLYDSGYAEVAGVEAYDPSVIMTTADADAQSVSRGTGISIGGTSFTVQVRQDDGLGFTNLKLELV